MCERFARNILFLYHICDFLVYDWLSQYYIEDVIVVTRIDTAEVVARIESLMGRMDVASLADAIGYSRQTLYHVFDKTRPPKYPPRADILYDIAQHFGTTVEYLLTGREPEVKARKLSAEEENLLELTEGMDAPTLRHLRRMVQQFSQFADEAKRQGWRPPQ